MLCKECNEYEIDSNSVFRCRRCLDRNAVNASNKRSRDKIKLGERYYEEKRKYGKVYREKNATKVSGWSKKHRATDKYKETSKKRRARNRDSILEYKREWDKNHPERLKIYYKKYNTTHQPRIIESSKKRKRLREENGGTFTYEQWIGICEKFGNKCAWCGKNKKLTVDHVIPLSKKGRNDINNIQPLCRNCNSRKNNKIMDFR